MKSKQTDFIKSSFLILYLFSWYKGRLQFSCVIGGETWIEIDGLMDSLRVHAPPSVWKIKGDRNVAFSPISSSFVLWAEKLSLTKEKVQRYQGLG